MSPIANRQPSSLDGKLSQEDIESISRSGYSNTGKSCMID
jgi:hypothetical protein